MAGQNIYDDPEFLAGYSQLARQVHGLDGAAEWPAVRALIPELAGTRALDLGCGFGWFTRWAAEHGATSVVGVDLSRQMLERARADTSSSLVRYQLADLDELVLPAESVELVYSSLTLHYIADLARLVQQIAESLPVGGAFVFSVEHPIFSAPSSQSFEEGAGGQRIWPLDRYLIEGPRSTTWLVDNVIKYHRTVGTYVNTLIEAGLQVSHVIDWGPSAQQLADHPEWVDEQHRPPFLIMKATKS